ncbi:hypothetical protein [Thioclava atlantica]|uniref:hypothetical protein n=1 Tax=Thioclava atlantica TaxID=1317124 RepID=UPI000AA4F2AC
MALELALSPRRIFAHPKVIPDQGRTALMRGPLVYCLEEVDNGPDLNSLVLTDDVAIEVHASKDLPTNTLVASAIREHWPDEALYRAIPPLRKETLIRAVPYYAWDNRARGAMLTWIRRETGK